MKASSGTVLSPSWSIQGTRDCQKATAQGPHQSASILSHQSSQAGTSTRAKAWVPTPCSWDRLARSIPHVAKWKHLASTPCRHQRLPASVLRPPRLPLPEDTSACGKTEGPGGYPIGGKSLLPLSTVQWTLWQCEEKNNAVFNTGLYWR